MITVFTPTYNRGSYLLRLFKSLCNQNFTDFEWVIVDDGSVDHTKLIISDILLLEHKFPINYIFQNNGGKHRAINNGLLHAKGDFFYIVDSDDFLPYDSLSKINLQLKYVASPNFAGVVGFRQFENGEIIGTGMKEAFLEANLIERRNTYNIKGDLAKVLKTDIFRKFPFPDIPGEKFVAESLVWNRISLNYKFRYFNEIIYTCEYLPDGLSSKSIKNRKNSPEYACLLYSELAINPFLDLKGKFKASINLWRFALCKKELFFKYLKSTKLFSLFAIPFGYFLFLKDCIFDSIKVEKIK